jgi:hypothetical protein
MSEVVNLAAMDSREAQVRQCISDLRRSIKQPDAIPRSFRGMASAIRVEASVCQDARRKRLIVKDNRLRALFHLNVIKRPQAAEVTETSFRARNL